MAIKIYTLIVLFFVILTVSKAQKCEISIQEVDISDSTVIVAIEALLTDLSINDKYFRTDKGYIELHEQNQVNKNIAKSYLVKPSLQNFNYKIRRKYPFYYSILYGKPILIYGQENIFDCKLSSKSEKNIVKILKPFILPEINLKIENNNKKERITLKDDIFYIHYGKVVEFYSDGSSKIRDANYMD